MFLEIVIVVMLTVLNGVLAMSELAVVSSRPARLRVLADQGSRGAAQAIKLSEHPGRFLSTVQIGITLVGVLSGAFSGATLGGRLANWLAAQGLSPAVSDALGVGTVVVAITYLSLIIGELVPKQIALRAPESVASKMAPAMAVLSKLALPLVWLLDASGKLVLTLLGQSGKGSDGVTDEEIKTVLAEAKSAGVIESEEIRDDFRRHAPCGPDGESLDDAPARRRSHRYRRQSRGNSQAAAPDTPLAPARSPQQFRRSAWRSLRQGFLRCACTRMAMPTSSRLPMTFR